MEISQMRGRFKGLRALGVGIVGASLALSLAACSGGSAPAETPAETVAPENQVTDLVLSRNTGGFESVVIADQQGYFKDQGLTTKIEVGGGPTAQIAAIVAGEFDIAMTGGPDVARAISEGVPVQVIGGVKAADEKGNESTDGLLLPPGSPIKTWADLSGKTVGIQGLGSLPQIVNTIALEKNNVDPKSVSYVNLPVDTLKDAALSGQVDAILPFSVFFMTAVDEGFTKLGRGTQEFLPGAPQIVWIASNEFIAKNPDTVKKFMTAMDKGSEYANANPDARRAVYHEFSKLPAGFIDNRMVMEPLSIKLDQKAWEQMLVAMQKMGNLTSDVTFDEIVWQGARS